MKKIILIIVVVLIAAGGGVLYFLYSKDDTIPSIKYLESVVYADSSYNVLKNVEASFGNSGGKIKCNDDLKFGENEVTCEAIGTNGLKESVTFIVNVSNTKGKNVIFFGDSIVYGWLTDGYSYANIIGDNYDLKKSVNAGISDYRLSTYDDDKKWLTDEVNNHKNDLEDYDYVILEGGVNDVIYDTPLGEMTDSFDSKTFDRNTFIGGLELYISAVKNNWNNAKIGYIICYDTSLYKERGKTWSKDTYQKYNDALIKVLNKWNIKYLDLSTDEFSKLLKTDTKTYLPDYLHLNMEGYKLITPYIYEFMQSL